MKRVEDIESLIYPVVAEVMDIQWHRTSERGAALFLGLCKTTQETASEYLFERLLPLGFYPGLRKRPDGLDEVLVLRRWGKQRIWLHLLLLVLTILSTLFVGSFWRGVDPLQDPLRILAGWPFSLTLLTILGTHELGHYFLAKKYRVDATLPYFLPLPLPPVGTLGAFIRIRSPIPSRKALLDIGAAGPFFGLLAAIPLTLLGLKLSHYEAITGREGGLYLGSSLLFDFLTKLLQGNPPPGHDLFLHPMAYAGWIGFLVTAINLIPIGQLDGGHIAYALLGKAHRYVARGTFLLLVTMGFFWPGWWTWAFLSLILGLDHPAPIHQEVALERNRKWLGILSFLLLILTFIPTPFKMMTLPR